MNNEQLIEQLKNLKSHLPEGELDSTRLDTEKSISELESKLADNSNYESKGAAFFNAQRRSELKDSVGKATASLVESQNNAVELQNKITVAQSQIEDIPNIVTDLEDKLTVTGRELRSNTNPTPEQDAEISSRLSGLRNEIAEYRSYEAELKGNIAEYQTDLEQTNTNVSKYQEREQRYKTLLDNFDARLKTEGNNVDVNAKINDENDLEALHNTKDALEAKFEYSAIDLDEELDDMINGLQNGTTTVEDVQNSLKSYKENSINPAVFDKTNEAVETEKEDIEKARNAVSMEISDLETKLADTNNYSVSTFVTERNDDRISDVTSRMNAANAVVGQLEADNARYTNEIAHANDEVEFSEEYIRGLRDEIIKWNVQSRSLDGEKDKDVILSLNNKISINEEEILKEQKNISNLLQEQVVIKNQLDANDNRKQMQLSKAARYSELSKRMTKDNSSDIDDYAMRLDQNRLASLKSSAKALDSRKAFLDYNFEYELDNIIGNKVVESVPVVENEKEDIPTVGKATIEPEVKSSIYDGSENFDANMFNDVNKMLEDSKKDVTVDSVIPSSELQEDDIIPAVNPVNEEKEDNIIDLPVINTPEHTELMVIDSDPIGVAAFEDADDELKDNAKNKKCLDKIKDKLNAFKKDFKKNWGKYLATLGIAVLIGLTLKSCSTDKGILSHVPGIGNESNIETSDQSEDGMSEDETEAEKDTDSAIDDAVKAMQAERSKTGYTGSATNGAGGNNKDNSGTSASKTSEKASKSKGHHSSGGGDVDIQGNSVDQSITGGQKLSTKDEVISNKVVLPPTDATGNVVTHEQTPDTSIKAGTTVTGGEVTGTKTEVISDNGSSNTTTPSETVHETTPDTTQPTEETTVVTGGDVIGETESESSNVVNPDESTTGTSTDASGSSTDEEVDNNVVTPQAEVQLNAGESYNATTTDGATVSVQQDVDGAFSVVGDTSAVNVEQTDDGATVDVNTDKIEGGEQIGEATDEVTEDNIADISESINDITAEQDVNTPSLGQ